MPPEGTRRRPDCREARLLESFPGRDYHEHLDHDHDHGNVRGILCFNRNGGLGQFRDSPDLLHKAIGYLRGTTWTLVRPGVYQRSSRRRASPPSPSF
ncbi:MAG TPA: endonuclease domain-containing protein [Micromonosporaceae bacterium]